MQLECCLELIKFLAGQQHETGEPDKALECIKVLQRKLRDAAVSFNRGKQMDLQHTNFLCPIPFPHRAATLNPGAANNRTCGPVGSPPQAPRSGLLELHQGVAMSCVACATRPVQGSEWGRNHDPW